MFDKFIHKYLRVPYRLNIQYRRRVKRSRATVLFLHGIGSSGAEWKEVIKELPADVSILTIDMLGFGRSPKPEWARYSADEQAKAVVATLIRSGVAARLIVVGHSLGALVAVEVARRYPLLVGSLILCSPPFYNPEEKRLLRADQLLKRLYSQVESNQSQFIKLASFAIKHRLVNPAFNVTEETMSSYIQTLKGSIISQTAFRDIQRLRRPITIIYGSLDPFVVSANLKKIAAINPSIKLIKVLAGHEIIGRFTPAIARVIVEQIKRRT